MPSVWNIRHVKGQETTSGLEIFIIFFGLIPFFIGLLILGYQSLTWLQHGYWPSFSLLDAITAMAEPGEVTYQWARIPDSWLGLHKILGLCPLWAFFIVPASLVIIVGLSIKDNEYQIEAGIDPE